MSEGNWRTKYKNHCLQIQRNYYLTGTTIRYMGEFSEKKYTRKKSRLTLVRGGMDTDSVMSDFL